MTTDEPADHEADRAVLARLRTICLGLTGTEEAELQDRPLFRVGRRRYAIFNGRTAPARARWADSGRSLHVLTDPEEAAALQHDGRFAPSPHHGDRGWMAIRVDDETTDWTEIAELLETAHRRAAARRAAC